MATSTTCINHPYTPATGTCPTCGRPMCDRCLLNTPNGPRCADCIDAAGLPGGVLGAGNVRSSSPSVPPAWQGAPPPSFIGNSNDLLALAAASSGAFLIINACTGGLACCVPPLLGIVGLVVANDSINPSRTRTLSWIGLGTGLLFVLFYVAIFGCIAIAGLAGAFQQSRSGGF